MELPSTTPLKTETNSMYFQFCSSALSPPVSSAEATWCRRDVERKQNAENESARGTEGAGELYTYYIPSGSLCGGEIAQHEITLV